MLYRENAINRRAAEAPYKMRTTDVLEALDYRWLGAAVVSPFAVIVAVYRAYDFIVALIRLLHHQY